MRDIYMTTKQLKKNRSKQICRMKTMTWADSHDTRTKVDFLVRGQSSASHSTSWHPASIINEKKITQKQK